jgi:hypothetical protein
LPQQFRAQAEDETERDPYQVRTVGNITKVGNAEPLPVGGVGLVTGLDGTGGDTVHDPYRETLVDDLRKEGVPNVEQLLTNPNNALVLISGFIPPGAHKGQKIDLEITLPRGSRVKSLRGGYLHSCKLYNYDFTRHLDPGYAGPNSALKGHPIIKAEGPVLVGLGDGEDADRLKRGRIWAGGLCLKEQPFALVMNTDQQMVRLSVMVGNRVNETFQADTRNDPGDALAIAQDKYGVLLKVPAQYRLNQPHFLRVIRFIPLDGQAALGPPTDQGGHKSYRSRLAEDLLNPARTVESALRLEALGQMSIETLKQGLSSPHPLVRFCAAESLAYLGCPACCPELARAVATQPMLRAFGLTALASIDESACHIKLQELLTTTSDAETRYGAFRALRALNEEDPLVQGELLNDSFWLHRLAPRTPGLIHISTTQRPEIVLFGEEPCLKPPFWLRSGDFCVTASKDDTRCTVCRAPLTGTPRRQQCSVKIDDILRTMADMDATYFEAIGILQQGHASHSVTCPICCDALPQKVEAQELARIGKTDINAGKTAEGQPLVPGGQELGQTPNLYERSEAPARGFQQELKSPRMLAPGPVGGAPADETAITTPAGP